MCEQLPENPTPKRPTRMASDDKLKRATAPDRSKSSDYEFSLPPKPKFDRKNSTDGLMVSEHSVQIIDLQKPAPATKSKMVLKNPYDSMATFADSSKGLHSPINSKGTVICSRRGSLISQVTMETLAKSPLRSKNGLTYSNSPFSTDTFAVNAYYDPLSLDLSKTERVEDKSIIGRRNIVSNPAESLATYLSKRKKDAEFQIRFHRLALEDLEDPLEWLMVEADEMLGSTNVSD